MKRLDYIVSHSYNLSRSEARSVIKEGRVYVSGIRETDCSKLADEKDVKLDGAQAPSEFVYVMMNKPSGYVCENGTEDSVLVLVPPEMRRKDLFTVGRLDKDTTGFLIITNDGDFGHIVASPKKNKAKVYKAELERDVSDEDIRRFRDGIDSFLPAELKPAGGKSAVVTVSEGKYHQVKRMFASTGNRVLALDRLEINGVVLDRDLAPGDCRYLTPEEIDKLKSN